MVKHSQLIICVKAIYFSLSSSSFFVPIVAAKWKMYEFFKLATDSCSRTFLTKGKGRRRLKGMLIETLLTEVWLPGLRASFETVQVRMALLLLVALDRVPQKTLSEAFTGQVSFAVGVAFKLNLCHKAAAWHTSHTECLSSSGRAVPGHAHCPCRPPSCSWCPSLAAAQLLHHGFAPSLQGYIWAWAPSPALILSPTCRLMSQPRFKLSQPLPRILSGHPRAV